MIWYSFTEQVNRWIVAYTVEYAMYGDFLLSIKSLKSALIKCHHGKTREEGGGGKEEHGIESQNLQFWK